MRSSLSGIFRARAVMLLLAALVALGSLATGHGARADGGVEAAQVANAGLAACSRNAGKALHNCVADVLDGMTRRISDAPDTTRALATAASQLRAAANKAQALSAISQCRAVVAGALKQALAMGKSGAGLSAVAGVLARAAQLIQSKG
mgnify:CR=1 FL=1